MEQVKDKHNYIYFSFVMHGIGALLPWNLYFNTKTYFIEYKFIDEFTGQKVYHLPDYVTYSAIATQIPSVIFQWANIFYRRGIGMSQRIEISLAVTMVLIHFTITFAMIERSPWRGALYWLTVVTLTLFNSALAIYMNTLYRMAAMFPVRYTATLLIGHNVGGLIITIINVITIAATQSLNVRAIYFFIVAQLVMLVCFDLYYLQPLNKFSRFTWKKKEIKKIMIYTDTPRCLFVIKKIWPQLLNVFLSFFVTFSIFPHIHSNIQASYSKFFVPREYYSIVTCSLTFNTTAMIASIFPSIFSPWPKPKYLWIIICLRLLYIPFFLLCNYKVAGRRTWPVLFGDAPYWTVATTFGLSAGYFSSVAMIYVVQSVEPMYAHIAGQFGAATLITGIFLGICSSFIWKAVVLM